MRTDLTFKAADGCELAAWLYLPEGGAGPFPGIVLSHGFGALKEMGLDDYAATFCRAGFACLAYDHRNTGASGGAVRGEIDPWQQVADMRDAITLFASLPEVDPDRLGLWGTSYAGGHAIVVAANDRRVKCVVSQVPTTSGYQNTVRAIAAEQMAEFHRAVALERAARLRGEPPRHVPISVKGSDSFEWSSVAGQGTAYVNSCTFLSRDMRMGYEPGAWLPRVSPTPLLMIVAKADTRCPTDTQLAAYSTAHEPKRLVLLEGGHYTAYTTQLEPARRAALDWFAQHLGGSRGDAGVSHA